jgi:prepilin-type N-terminal cleavage/methylation domain-containing protein
MNIIFQKSISSAFSLVELLTVTAIIAILAAFAIPSYMHHITETKVNSMWQEAESARMIVESKYIKTNAAPSTVTVNSGAAEYTSTNTDFIKCITIQSGVVSVVGQPSKFSSLNIWISWTPTVSSGLLSWACAYSSDAVDYLPDAANNCSVGSPAYSTDSAC